MAKKAAAMNKTVMHKAAVAGEPPGADCRMAVCASE